MPFALGPVDPYDNAAYLGISAFPSNPQTGSGGAGSGGLVKIISTSSNIGKVDVSGGGKPLQQNWSPEYVYVRRNGATLNFAGGRHHADLIACFRYLLTSLILTPQPKPGWAAWR